MHRQHYFPQIVGSSNQQIPLMVDIALVDYSGLPIQLAPAGVLLDAAGTPQTVTPHTGLCASHAQPALVLSGEDQLAHTIPAPGQQMLPGSGILHIAGPLQSGFLEPSHQVESGALYPERGPFYGYHGNYHAEPIVFMQQQPWQQRHQGCSTVHSPALFPPGVHGIDMDAYNAPVNFAHDHMPYTNQYVATAPGTHAGITSAHHSTMILEGAPYSSEQAEFCSRVPQPWMVLTQPQQVATDNSDIPVAVVQHVANDSTEQRSYRRVLPKRPRCNNFDSHAPGMSLLDQSTTCKLEQRAELVKPVETSCPSRSSVCDKLDPINKRLDVALEVAEQRSRHLPEPESIAENILDNFTVDMTSLQCTLTNTGAAEQREPAADCTENPSNLSCGVEAVKQLFPASYEIIDSAAELSPRGTQRRVVNASCATTALDVISSPPHEICNDNRKTTEDTNDAIEVLFDSADAVRTRRSFTSSALDDVGGLISGLPQSLDFSDLAEFSALTSLPLDDICNVAMLNTPNSSGEILATASTVSGAQWETEEVLKLMSSPSGSGGTEDKPVEAVVARAAACPDKPTCVISSPAAGTNSTKKRKLSEVHEASASPPEQESSEPKYQKCCCREACSGEVKRRAYSRPSTCDLVTMPWTEFFDRLDAQNKRGKNSRKRKASKKSKRKWT